MDITEIASKMFLEKISGQGSQPSLGVVQDALKNLLPTEGGDINISSLVGQFMSGGGLASMAQSWLGDGGNEAMSPQKLFDVLGESKVQEFAGKVGVDANTAASGLSDMIPDLIDKASSGGSLKDNIGGALASGLASKLFG